MLALSVAAAVGAAVYQYARRRPRLDFAPASAPLASLDRGTLLTLRDVAQAVLPVDDYLPWGSAAPSEMTLELAPWLGADTTLDVPLAMRLSGGDWRRLGDLVGDVDE